MLNCKQLVGSKSLINISADKNTPAEDFDKIKSTQIFWTLTSIDEIERIYRLPSEFESSLREHLRLIAPSRPFVRFQHCISKQANLAIGHSEDCLMVGGNSTTTHLHNTFEIYLSFKLSTCRLGLCHVDVHLANMVSYGSETENNDQRNFRHDISSPHSCINLAVNNVLITLLKLWWQLKNLSFGCSSLELIYMYPVFLWKMKKTILFANSRNFDYPRELYASELLEYWWQGENFSFG